LAGYDLDPVGALTIALRRVLDQPDLGWPALIQAAGFSDTRTAALLVGDPTTLDTLAADLNELRRL
jgi:hypothetical protein